MVEEIWKNINDFPGYQVSNMGRVRSWLNYGGRIVDNYHVLAPIVNKRTGYWKVNLNRDGNSYSCYIHTLVADAFCGGRQPGLEVNHNDGNKANNCYSNLSWTTRSENIKHAFATGLKTAIKSRSNSVSVKIVETGEIFDTITDCAKAVGNRRDKISQCVDDTHWRTTYNGYHYERVYKKKNDSE